MSAAIAMLAAMPRRGGRVAVLGSMLELGPRSGELHREIANDVANQGFEVVVATGEFADAFGPHRTALGSRLVTAQDPLVAWQSLASILNGDEVVLLKGSRGVALERLLPHFEEQWGSFHPHGEAFGSRGSSRGTGTRDEARTAERPQSNHDAAAKQDAAQRRGD
jgi:UDP-N-acetylmuramoyl-tripeptide--D-alanyl-D-alanine ligase